jgi:UPF0755 protein
VSNPSKLPSRPSSRTPDPYQEKQGPGRAAVWIVRLFFLFVVVVACAAASLLLAARWLGAEQAGQVRIEGGDPDLPLVERLQLESYLSTHAAELEQPAGPAGDPVPFVIASGQGAGQIAVNLAAAGLVAEADLFLNYARYYGLETRLAAGNFQIDPQITVPELAAILTNPYNQIQLSFLPGWRLEEMAGYLAATTPGNIDAQEFLAIVQRRQAFDLSPFSFLVNHPAGSSLEGYLFPGFYDVPVEATAADLVTLMLNRFDKSVTPAMRQAYGVNGLSLREAVILASIVERESPIVAERPLIAGVFLNRLAQGMPLQADPTVQYALGYYSPAETWWKAPLDGADVAVESAYNTYQIPGLPPGPIANPSLTSLEAVAAPEETNFIFFVLDCENQDRHLFSVTYAEHLEKVGRCAAP